MGVHLSADDNKFIHDLIGKKVLRPVDGHRLNQRDGVILITCGDADQFPDIFTHLAGKQKHHREETRIHVCAWNGGAIRLAHRSPANKRSRTTDADCLDDVLEARQLKGINTVASVIHAPCGRAVNSHLTVEDAIKLHHEAKMILKRRDFTVSCFVQVDRLDGRKLTWFLERESWDNWARENGSERHWPTL